MSSNEYRPVGFSDADAATLAEIAAAVEKTQADLAALQARMTRELARAEELACRQSSGATRSAAASDMAHRAIASELATPLRIADRTMQRRMTQAAEIAHEYPATLDSLAAGRITMGHVYAIAEAGAHLPHEARAEFEAAALRKSENDTVGRVRPALRMLAERLHPRTLTERHIDARETRSVTLNPLDDGMCELTATLPLILGEGIHNRLTQQGTALQDERMRAVERLREARAASLPASEADEVLASDGRTIDQLRADIFADMLLTAQPSADPTRTDDRPGALGAIRAHVQVVVPVLAIAGTHEYPADLAGRSPIDAETARQLVGAESGWDRLLTHPVSGEILATDRYQPTPDIRRRLRARDAHCRFPGCRVPALRCEHDHTVDFALGGKTRLDNLAGLCQRHHSMKQFTAWKVTQIGDGILAWTSPLGRPYLDHPPAPTVHFVPDEIPLGVPSRYDDDDDPPPWENCA